MDKLGNTTGVLPGNMEVNSKKKGRRLLLPRENWSEMPPDLLLSWCHMVKDAGRELKHTTQSTTPALV